MGASQRHRPWGRPAARTAPRPATATPPRCVARIGPRPLLEDNSVKSRATSIVNGEIGYKFSERVRLAAEGFNLLDAEVSDIDYFFESRLRDEPALAFTTLVDLFDDEAGLAISNSDDVEEVTKVIVTVSVLLGMVSLAVWVWEPGEVRVVIIDAQPIHRVSVDGFWMSTTEITNQAFADFGSPTRRQSSPTR